MSTYTVEKGVNHRQFCSLLNEIKNTFAGLLYKESYSGPEERC